MLICLIDNLLIESDSRNLSDKQNFNINQQTKLEKWRKEIITKF